MPRRGVVVEGQVEQAVEPIRVFAALEPNQCLDASVKVAVHQVCRANPMFLVAAAVECEHSRVFEEAAEDTAHANRFGQSRYAGSKRADATYPNVDRYAGLRRLVQRINGCLVHDAVDFESN